MKALEDMSLEELWQLFPIILKTHSPDYALWYEEEKASLLSILGARNICRINHIGSTSVKGLLAKPIVDILLELPAAYEMDNIVRLLENAGWILMIRNDENGILELNKGYTPNGFAEKVYHLHIKPFDDWDELYFRDYLRTHPDVARQYETLKQRLQKQYEHNRDAYTEAKTDFVLKYSRKAREEFGKRYAQPVPGGAAGR